MPDPTPVTLMLQDAGSDPAARSRLLAAVYDELREMARRRLQSERVGHTLQPTALVHEAYMKLVGPAGAPWKHRGHFFGACANAMRQILVEHARARNARKRGGGAVPVTVEAADVADTADLSLVLAVNDLLDQLRAEDPDAAQVVELRFFGGLEMKEIGEVMGTSERTAQREWAYARVRLQQMFEATRRP